MPSPTQTGKAAPRVIAGRDEDSKSPRAAAIAAAALLTIAAAATLPSVVLDAVRSDVVDAPAPGVVSAAVLAAASLVAVAVLAIMAAVGRPAVAGALAGGYGAISVGSTVFDVQLLLSPIDANRLELFRPTTAGSLHPAFASYSLIFAHAVGVLAGLVGLIAVGRASYGDGYGSSVRADLVGRASAVRIGGLLSLLAALGAVAAAGSMFAAPFVSTDSVVLVPAVVQSPVAVAVGSGLVAVAVLVVVAAALASTEPSVAAGALVGSGAGLLGLAGSRVLAGASSGAGIDVSTGSWVAAAAAVVLVAVGLLALPVAAIRDRRGGSVAIDRAVPADPGHALRWHVSAGIAGAVSGVLLVVGGLVRVLDVPDGVPNPEILATRTAVIAGVVLVVMSVPMFFSLFAGAVRPALGVVAVAAIMSATGVLQSVVLATDIDGIGVGPGGAAIGLGLVVAVIAGGLVLVAGSAERDDVDTSDIDADRTVGWVALAGAVVSAVALALPLYRGTDLHAASIAELPWGWDVWGQAALAVTLVIGAVVAGRARPTRGAALAAGSVVAMVIYLLGWPLTQGRALDPTVGPGVFAGVLGAVILAVAAVLSARRGAR